MSEYIKVLLIEDNPADSDLIEDILSGVEDQVFEFVTAGRLSVALELLADRGIDIILCDLSLPDSHCLETFLAVRDKARNQPIIVLSGLSDETVTEITHGIDEGAVLITEGQSFLNDGQKVTPAP